MSPDAESRILRRLDRLEDGVNDRLAVIENHVRLTNGRVTELEKWKARLDGAKEAVGWVPPLAIGMACATVGAVAGHFF